MHPLFFLSVCFCTASRIISIRPLPITFTSESVHGMFMERGFVGGLYEIFSVNFRGNLRCYLRSNYDYLGIVGKNYWDNFFRRPCKCVHMHPLFFLSVCFRTASRIISIRPLPTALTSESVHGMFMEWRNNTKSFSNI